MRWPAAILCCGTLLLGGCSYLSSVQRGLDKVTGAQARKEKELAAVRSEYDGKIEANTKALTAAKEEQVGALKGQIQGAASSLYGADAVFRTVVTPTRPELVTNNLVNEAWTALGRVQPTYAAMQAMNARLKDDLDAAKTSLADLQRNHQTAVSENQKLSDAAKAAADKVAALERAKADMETDYRKQLDAKQGDLVRLANDKAALEKERSDNAAAIHAMKLKLSMIAGGLALLCVAGVIYSPVGKGGLAIFGAVCGLASVGIWYITGPVILAAVAVAVVVAAGYGLYQHHASDKTVTALTGYLHEKGQLAEADLQAWMTRYIKHKDGTVTTVPDPTVRAVVNDKLAFDNKL